MRITDDHFDRKNRKRGVAPEILKGSRGPFSSFGKALQDFRPRDFGARYLP
jgi:hypothetical protein